MRKQERPWNCDFSRFCQAKLTLTRKINLLIKKRVTSSKMLQFTWNCFFDNELTTSDPLWFLNLSHKSLLVFLGDICSLTIGQVENNITLQLLMEDSTMGSTTALFCFQFFSYFHIFSTENLSKVYAFFFFQLFVEKHKLYSAYILWRFREFAGKFKHIQITALRLP